MPGGSDGWGCARYCVASVSGVAQAHLSIAGRSLLLDALFTHLVVCNDWHL